MDRVFGIKFRLQMEIFLSSNILLLRKRRRKTQDDVASAVNVKRTTYTGIEIGNSFPSIEVLVGISNYFGVSIDTLLKVDLSKLSSYQLSELERGSDVYIRGSQIRILSKTTDKKNQENIELVPEKAKAGYSTGFADPDYINDLPKFQLPFLSKNRKYRAFQITGDSMLPITRGVVDYRRVHSGLAHHTKRQALCNPYG